MSLYHISASGRPINGFDDIGYEPAAITPYPAHTITSGTTRPENEDSPKVLDDDSIRTRKWDLQSCATEDLGIGSRVGQQEHLIRSKRRHIPLEQERQTNIRDNNVPINGLPGEDVSFNGLSDKNASTPESLFYAELIDIMKNYHEQQRVIERAFEANQISEEQRRRENCAHRIALDVNVRAAADMSGYEVSTRCSQVKYIWYILELTMEQILTNEKDIQEAIKKLTAYSIYSFLLQIRDHETWQRIFKRDLMHQHHAHPVTAPQQHAAIPENFLIWLARKIRRGLRFVLAVPDDADLRTYSSRRLPNDKAVPYQSKVGVLGSNVPSQLQNDGEKRAPEPSSVSLRENFASTRKQPRPSTQTEQAPKILNDATKINNNTMLPDVTLASPLHGRHIRVPRGRGYDQDAFVTVLNPFVVNIRSEKTKAGCGGGSGGRYRTNDEESKVTAWSEADC